LRFHLLSFEPTSPSCITSVGTVGFNVHDVIDVSPYSGHYEIWNKDYLIGLLQLEITFNYGSFGFGYSFHFAENKPEEYSLYSLLPRILPPRENCEPDTCVLTANAVPHPDYIPFDGRVKLSYGKSIDTSQLESSQRVDPRKIKKRQFHIKDLVDKYYEHQDRVERLAFLYRYVQGTDEKV
jgi:hypothetical protein